MILESVATPSLLEWRATVAQRLRAYGAFDGYTAEAQRSILAQACLIIVPLTAGAQGRIIYLTHLDGPADEALSQAVLHTIARLYPDVIEAMRGSVNICCLHFWDDGWHPTQWDGCANGLNEVMLEVFVTDLRQQALAACERGAP
jgi:hypothetical protein